jgi:predicted TIM-barrel fold metal-dependent hydrolase
MTITDVLAEDLDSHEFIPVHMWEEIFGSAGRDAVTCWNALYAVSGGEEAGSLNNLRRPDVVADDTEITPETVWTMKGCAAPGAIDLRRRGEVLDAMGVSRQLIFPNFGFLGLGLAAMSDEYFDGLYKPHLAYDVDHREVGLDIIRAHNDWLIQSQQLDPRLHLVAIVPTFSIDEMMAEAQRVLEGGARCLWIPATMPPAGTSPANSKLDPFWALAEAYDVPVVLHIGTEPLLNVAWNDAEAFRRDYDCEFPTTNPYFMTVFSFAPENFLASMVMGGVFDRHPRLRFGIIECGASWLGPLVERMENFFPMFAETRKLSRTPTEFVNQQVRITPFVFEDTARHFEWYPGLQDTYCFSSDYPHVEGGQHAKERFLARLSPLGDEAVEKFFSTMRS